MEKRFDRSYFEHARVGLFTHYTYATYADGKSTNWGGTWYSRDSSRGASSPEEAAAMFDGEKYAQTAHDMGAEYVVFTLAHAGFNLLFPSETMKATGCTHKCTEKSDIITKLLDGLDRYGIPLVFYLPPNDAHDIRDEDLRRLGWTDDAARMEFLKKLIREIYGKYGRRVRGFWFDQGGPTADVCAVVRECDPDAVIFVNTGVTANPQRHPLSDITVSEYYGSIEGCDSDTLPTHFSQVNRQIGGWWAAGHKAPTDARNLYRYSVRTVATEGQFNAGIAWSCGPYIDQTWEDGVRELLGELGDLLRAHEGIYGTVPGKSYVTAPNALLARDDWGVSTESPDGKTVYLHVLNLPADGMLTLPAPADGKIFTGAACGTTELTLTKLGAGYRITLPEHGDPIDTVVRLTAE
ncbi:MAG: alpha-L-fucosidase [Clostridia bacterium]|nr:alpha-L-fucosidase [Clostridia bacterium]